MYVLGESTSDCGYCGPRKSGKGGEDGKQSYAVGNAALETSVSYGMHAEVLSVQTYQALLDRGWRRSGKWLYKPVLRKTCCQLQTIRLEVEKFKMSGSQKRVQRRWETYLQGGWTVSGVEDVCGCGDGDSIVEKSVAGSDGGISEGTDRLSVDMLEIEDIVEEDGQEHLGDELEPKRPRSPLGDDTETRTEGPEGVEVSLDDGSNTLVTPSGKRMELSGTEFKWKRQRSQLCLDSLVDNDQRDISPSVGFTEKLRVDSISTELADGQDVRAAVARALENAVTAAKREGEIPDMKYPDIILKYANGGLKKTYGSDLMFSSSIAFSISGKAKSESKKKGAMKQNDLGEMTPDVVATCLLKHVSLDAKWVVSLRQVNGHVNVFCATGREVTLTSTSKNAKRSANPKPSIRAKIAQQSKATTTPKKKTFKVVTVPSSHPDIPKVEYELFKKYQTIHHNDKDVSLKSFKRFLCDSPLTPVSRDECPTAPTCGYGSFHQQYWVDDQLVAVGVVDVLPKCLSSKYFFWDPSMAKLSLGTLASLLEIQWVKSQAEQAPEFRYYYLGYYLHDCHRMRYKASFAPSELLCPLTFEWVPIATISQELDRGVAPWNMRGSGADEANEPQTCFEDEQNTLDNLQEIDDVNLAITFPNSQRQAWKVLPFKVVRQLGLIRSGAEELSEAIKHWKDMVGPVCCSNMLYAV